uniref:Uncharacterized protein n=1 Tax=Ditylenchus dipsaci TaxID=166011 RepID=A0A915ETK0_9BILA
MEVHWHRRRQRSYCSSAIFLFSIILLVLLPYGTLSPLPSRTLEDKRPLWSSSRSPANPSSTVLPHCSKAILTVSHSSRLIRRSSTSSSPQLSLNIGVGQTVCFRLQEHSTPVNQSSITQNQKLDSIPSPIPSSNTISKAHSSSPSNNAISALEQYHPITERYRFAIPQVETNCICECNAQSSTCQADEYKYGVCSSSTDQSSLHHISGSEVCHRTFFANQPSHGCAANSQSSTSDQPQEYSGKQPRLCCQLRFTPYGNRVFTALRLEAPTTFAVLRYSVYGWNGDWVEVERRKVRVQLDGSVHNTFLQELYGLKLSVLGMGSRSGASELEPGMYLVENLAVGSYGELISQPVNKITENDFHKLGWFRLNERGQPFVQSGDIFMDKIHHARSENCAEQNFRSVLEASYYINKGDDNGSNDTSSAPFPLAQPLNRVHRWIHSARVFDASERQVVITAGEGINLDLTLTTTPPSQDQSQSQNSISPATISFIHNSSQLTDFTATILVDHFSNSLLNLTVYGAKGVLNGYIRQLEEWNGEDIDSFSVAIPTVNYKTTVNSTSSVLTRIKPYPINSIQVVCLRPDDADQTKELCRPVQSIQFELDIGVSVGREWRTGVGKCPECNAISVDGFMKYLNPANWTKGVHSVSDALMLASDIFGYIFVFLAVYIVLTKIVIPLVGCFLCPMSIFYRRSKK